MFSAGQLIWLDGPIDPAAFASSVSTVFAETDALRVRFSDDDGIPFQYVDTATTLSTEIVDAGHGDDQIRVLAREQLTGAPATAAEPTTSSTLIRRSDGTWAWILVTNILLVDGYSISLFIRRVAEVYSATQAADPVPDRWFGNLKDVTEQGDSSTEEGVAYWTDILEVETADHRSVEDFSEAFVSSSQPVVVPLADDTYSRVQQSARTARVSWTDSLIALWGVYTALVDGRDYVAVRVPLMLRDDRESLKTPSAISRAIPVVTEINPYQTFGNVLEVVADQLKTSRRHTAVEDHQIARLWPSGQASYLALPTINIRLFESTPTPGRHRRGPRNHQHRPGRITRPRDLPQPRHRHPAGNIRRFCHRRSAPACRTVQPLPQHSPRRAPHPNPARTQYRIHTGHRRHGLGVDAGRGA